MFSIARLATCVLGAALLLAACGRGIGGCSTPDEALRALQEGLRANDAARVMALLDGDSRAYYRQEVRTARARRAAGEAPRDGHEDPQLVHELYHTGSPEDAAAHLALRNPPLDSISGWIADYTVLERSVVRQDDGQQLATLRVRTSDGTEHALFMIHELDGWVLDAYRHFQESMKQR